MKNRITQGMPGRGKREERPCSRPFPLSTVPCAHSHLQYYSISHREPLQRRELVKELYLIKMNSNNKIGLGIFLMEKNILLRYSDAFNIIVILKENNYTDMNY